MGKRKEFENGDCIDITRAASTTAARPEPEVIDLAEDSPPAPSGMPHALGKLDGAALAC